MKRKNILVLLVTAMFVMAIGISSIATMPAFAQGKSQDLGTNWRVYNVKPDTSSFWDINKPQSFEGGLLQFPVQPFLTRTTGSFAVYLLNNYNADMTGKTLTANAFWTPGLYKTRTADTTNCGGAYVRFEFQDVASGPYDSNDYWWSTGTAAPLALDLNTSASGALTASLANRSLWTNQAGKSANDTTAPWTDWTGATVTVSPYDGFTNAVKKVKQVGLSFGNQCAYASGVARDGGAGTFQLANFTIAP